MDKIPGNSNQSPSVSQPETSKVANKGKLGSKQVSSTDTKGYLDKTANPASGKALGNRQITPHNLDMIALLGQEQRWEGLSSAINIHGNTVNGLTQILNSLEGSNIKVPADIQDQICLRFTELEALTKAVILKSQLPDDPLQELGVLSNLIFLPENHDSATGVIARQAVDGFIKTHNLNSANREHIVQDMSERMYSMTAERMKSLEDQILTTTRDATLKQEIKYAQNERRIEENYRRAVSVKS